MKHSIPLLFVLVPALGFSQAQVKKIDESISGQKAAYESWYKHLHANPELSTMEEKTAAYLKKELLSMGYEITDSMGYHSFAAVLRNGKGPVVLYRTDMDGLPLKELTNLDYASKVQVKRGEETVSAMHACGHDIHMSSWLGTARAMAEMKSLWTGTLILLAQSAEETGQGAKKVVASPAFRSLPKPDIQLAFHDHAELLTGQAGFCDGFAMAATDMLNITFYGKGGHGAVPQQAIDPVLLAAQFVTAIQSIVSRNLSPNDPAVITVGAINGGTVGNIIPDQVTLKLTIRSYSKESRELIFNRLKTIGNNLAAAAGLEKDRMPVFDLLDMSIPSVYNDPILGERLRNNLVAKLGEQSVTKVQPIMIGEDFGIYGQQESRIPSYLVWIGTVSPERKELARQGKTELPSLHSPRFAPDYQSAIPGAVRVMTNSLMDLMPKQK
ncbi:amidohydrolase [Flavihumibacter rivuli]|uniref:M20 metallopeptidase family protein n=1 Tax=Flavihumibacter rivuli TaxID=2838156 RepID=UPI001BDEE7D3|nr:amidohydrolase [Flavihumibacter rivuli]ULQ55671.1 amidohydrolase [Flavihumibacter rivuli]